MPRPSANLRSNLEIISYLTLIGIALGWYGAGVWFAEEDNQELQEYLLRANCTHIPIPPSCNLTAVREALDDTRAALTHEWLLPAAILGAGTGMLMGVFTVAVREYCCNQDEAADNLNENETEHLRPYYSLPS